MEADIKSGYVKVDDINIHYLSAGEGSPVFLLHGGGADCAGLSWRLSIGLISREHRVFAPDLPGYGNSDKPRIKYSSQYYVDFLGRLMNVLQVERASLVGLSLGGAVSLGFALKSPHRVDRLLLVDSHGLGGGVPLGIVSYLLVRLPFLLELMWKLKELRRAAVKRSLRNIISNPQAVTEELVDEVHQLIKKPGTSGAFVSWVRNEVTPSGFRTSFIDRLR